MILFGVEMKTTDGKAGFVHYLSTVVLYIIYRLITAYLLLRVNLDKIMHAR